MNGKITEMTVPNYSLTIVIMVLAISMGVHHCDAKKTSRILDVKDKIFAESGLVTLFDIVVNSDSLSSEERKIRILNNSENKKQESLIGLAYQLQKYPTMYDVYLRGPKNISIEWQSESKHLSIAQQEVIHRIRESRPWIDWEINVDFDIEDERKLLRHIPFNLSDLNILESRQFLGQIRIKIGMTDPESGVITSEILSPRITRKVSVVVVREKIAARSQLREADLDFIPIWINSDRKDYVSSLIECIGKESSRTLPAGQVLRSKDLSYPVSVRRGDTVWVSYKMAGLSVRVEVLAMENGRKGESIKVKNPTSQKVLRVELIGNKEAVLNPINS